MKIHSKILSLFANYLTVSPTFISESKIKKITSFSLNDEEAYCLLLAALYDLNDKEFIHTYLRPCLHCLNENEYTSNSYYQNIHLPQIQKKKIKLGYGKYVPYEAFVMDDFASINEVTLLPQIGFFKNVMKYPAIYENNHLWMSVTPNEINTMKDPILKAHGKVITFGLGLGYFAYMVSLKDNVKEVCIVESNPTIIEIFKKFILPQFAQKDKIQIIQSDAFSFIASPSIPFDFDFTFVDIYHDVSDGKEIYLKMKPYELLYPHCEFHYWILKSIQAYL